MKKFYLSILIIFFYSYLNSQKIENVSYKIVENIITINYDITNAKKNQFFDVKLFYKTNGDNWKLIPNEQLYGNIGKNQIHGENKKIIWNPNANRVEIIGNLQFKVKATVIDQNNQNKNFDIPETVFIKGGNFYMGSNNGNTNEQPLHKVIISDFYMSKFEITNKQYIEFLNDINCNKNGRYNKKKLIDIYDNNCPISYKNNKFYFKGSSCARDENSPVIQVTWYGANEYCNWLSQKTGQTYRLPTEAQWEYAAGGSYGTSKRYIWAGTNSKNLLEKYAWYKENSHQKGMYHQNFGVNPVGLKKPNPYRLYDMSGNVREWCSDLYGKYTSKVQTNPQGAENGKLRVIRGGGWYSSANDCKVTKRTCNSPSNSNKNIGFRVCKNIN